MNTKSRAWFAAKEQGAHLRRAYGLTAIEYLELLQRQGGRCAICRRWARQRLVVDHDHGTGSIRGLLCTPCNAGIGMLGDSVSGIMRAVDYLRRANAKKA